MRRRRKCVRVNAEARIVERGRKPRADEDEHPRDFLLIEGKVLSAERLWCGNYIQIAFLCFFLCIRRPKAIVDRCRRTFVPVCLYRRSIRRRQLLCKRTDTRSDVCTFLRIHAARRPLDESLLGNDIPRIPRLDMRDTHETCGERIEIACDNRLYRLHKRRRQRNRIHPRLGMCGVCPLAAKTKDKAIHRRHHRPRRDADRADLKERRCVQPKDRRDILQCTRLDEYLRTARSLLRRLKEDPHAPRELRLALFEQQGRSKHRGDVKIVPTGVHTARVLRAIRQIRLLLDGQCIDIAAQGEDGIPRAYLRNNARLEWKLQNAKPRPLQGGTNPLRCLHFFIGELRMAVKPLKFFRDVGIYIFNVCHFPLPF